LCRVGFHVKYRIAQDADESQVPELTQNYINSNFSSELVLSPTATMYVLSTLQKFTWYEVRVQPFYSTVHGAESNAVRARTLEDGSQFDLSFIIELVVPLLIQIFLSLASPLPHTYCFGYLYVRAYDSVFNWRLNIEWLEGGGGANVAFWWKFVFTPLMLFFLL